MSENTLIEDKYKLVITNFEGPLDLLLFLINKNKMNIFDISLAELTDKYIEYLDEIGEKNLEIETEFLVMAANLLYIKSKKLIPALEPEEEIDEEMLEAEILMRIIEYKKYKEKQDEFKGRYELNFGTFEKMPENIKVKRKADLSNMVDKNGLLNMYLEVQKRNKEKLNIKAKNIDDIAVHEKVTIKSKVKQILSFLIKKTSFVFGNMYNSKKEKPIEVVTAFLSILELSRLKHVKLEQKDMFGDILVRKGKVENVDLSLIKEQ